jgi:hypothetical protein
MSQFMDTEKLSRVIPVLLKSKQVANNVLEIKERIEQGRKSS